VTPSGGPALRGLYTGRGLPPVVRRLGTASFFQDVASEMVYPLLPAFLASLGGGPALLGAMESAAEGIVAWVKGWAGRASDRAGRRKPFVLFGYGASAVARPLLAVAAVPWHVVALRLWDRFAKGIRTAPRDALLGEAVPARDRAYAFAFHRGLDHLGAACGPLAAAALLALGTPVRRLFLLATLPALAGVAAVLFGVADAPAAAPPKAAPRRVATPRALRAVMPAAFFFGLANASDAFLLLRAADLGAPTPALALLWAAFHVVRWSASAPGGRLADRIGAGRSLLVGWTLYGALYLAFGAAGHLAAFLALLVPYAAHAGLVEGAERSLAVELGGAEAAGASLGAWHRTTGYGALGASLLFGALWERVSPASAFFAAGCCALIAVALLLLSKPGTGSPATPRSQSRSAIIAQAGASDGSSASHSRTSSPPSPHEAHFAIEPR
jgi:MFS family permease